MTLLNECCIWSCYQIEGQYCTRLTFSLVSRRTELVDCSIYHPTCYCCLLSPERTWKMKVQDFAYFNMKHLASLWMPLLSADAFSFWGVFWYFFLFLYWHLHETLFLDNPLSKMPCNMGCIVTLHVLWNSSL